MPCLLYWVISLPSSEKKGGLNKDSHYPIDSMGEINLTQGASAIFSVSDGATESFDSGKWANILTTEYSKKEWVFDEFIISCQKRMGEYYNSYVRNIIENNLSMPSWQYESFQEGDIATFAGVKINYSFGCVLEAVGDSCVLKYNSQNEFVFAFPYNDPDMFNTRPLLINSRHGIMNGGNSDGVASSFIQCEPGDTLLLCTDAISEYILTTEKEKKTKLTDISFGQLIDKSIFQKSKKNFKYIVDATRQFGHLKDDDVTVVAIKFFP